MRYLGKISDPKDLVTKEYVDNASSGGSAISGLSAGFVKADGNGGLSSIATVPVANGGTGATTAEDALVNLNALSNANGAVHTANIADDAITADKLGDGSVNSLAIAEQAVTASKIGPDVTYSTIGLTLNQVRNIYIGTDTPSNSIGNDGDIYIKYNA